MFITIENVAKSFEQLLSTFSAPSQALPLGLKLLMTMASVYDMINFYNNCAKK